MDSQNSETLLVNTWKLYCSQKGAFNIPENRTDLPLVSNLGDGAPGCLVELQHNQVTRSTCDSRGIFLLERETTPSSPTELQRSSSRSPLNQGVTEENGAGSSNWFSCDPAALTHHGQCPKDPHTKVMGAVQNSTFCCQAKGRAQIMLAQHPPCFPLVSVLSCVAAALWTLKAPTVHST